jgi:hypothetical protein
LFTKQRDAQIKQTGAISHENLNHIVVANVVPASTPGTNKSHRSKPVATFGRNQAYSVGSFKRKDQRRASRRKSGVKAWIGLDGGFAVRPCSVIDLSDTGVQITIDAPDSVPSIFNFLMSRTAGSGRRARVKWRRGSQIGAEFL